MNDKNQIGKHVISSNESDAVVQGEVVETLELPDNVVPFKKPEPADGEPEEPPYHSVLESWSFALEPAAKERLTPPTPQWASRILQTYPGLTFADMGDVHARFYDLIDELHKIILFEISTDDECLNVTNEAEDIEQNSGHYLNLLVEWQKCFLSHELQWHFLHHDAAAQLAALSEVHAMFFSETGITAHLESINFQFTESDQQYLADELNAMKEAQ